MSENEKYIHDQILINIKSGFDSLDAIIEDTIEVVEDEALQFEISEEWIREQVTTAYNKHIEDAKSWKNPTDPQRLIKVFDKLCDDSIIAAHCIGYTTDEAIYDIQQLWLELEDASVKPIGYCYYHGQDLERAIETNVLLIGFHGAKEKDEKAAIAIGNKVFAALKDEGFDVTWENAADKRIQINNFEWHNLYVDDETVEELFTEERILKRMIK